MAYAPKSCSLSGYACVVKVPQQDFMHMLRWNTQLAPHEAQAITDQTATSMKKDQPQQAINNFIEKGRNKVVFKQLRDGVRASRDSLKCHLTTGAAEETVQRATSLIDEGEVLRSDWVSSLAICGSSGSSRAGTTSSHPCPARSTQI